MDRIPVSKKRTQGCGPFVFFGVIKKRGGHAVTSLFIAEVLRLLLEVANSVVNLLALVLTVKQQREVVGTQP